MKLLNITLQKSKKKLCNISHFDVNRRHHSITKYNFYMYSFHCAPFIKRIFARFMSFLENNLCYIIKLKI